MQRYELHLHPGFVADIYAEAEWIERQADQAVAQQWLDRVIVFAESLDFQPIGYTLVHDGPPRAAFRVPFERRRLVFYERFDAERAVRVLYLWHAARGERPGLDRQWDALDA